MACSSSSEKKTVVLISKDGETFEVEEAVALLSETVKNVIEDDCTAGGIPLPNVDGRTLAKVVEFCKEHASNASEEALKTFDSKFLDNLDNKYTMLLELALAATYLNIKILFDLTCQTVAGIMKGKNAEEIRKLFNIKNDFTPEEEEEVRKEIAWALDN